MVAHELIKLEKVTFYLTAFELRHLHHYLRIYLKSHTSPVKAHLANQLIYEALEKVQLRLESFLRSERWRKLESQPEKLVAIKLPLTTVWLIQSFLQAVSLSVLTRLSGNLTEVLRNYSDLFIS
ncbi:hypothetical protein [Siphonobacter sp. SORGH_AS_0500]|uniref:hypothetical protein n=1 Tax=Siphonobacter sp. SORGH_AS_0500 TaxID=1864824 RepID=UPI0028560B47|nr:hypothetical protein [Siphonobacter sp. SORGH_AS_0500]MDR6194746.1 hypothetical protein [Siphonobacter sp. SORGH_AS_0500]